MCISSSSPTKTMRTMQVRCFSQIAPQPFLLLLLGRGSKQRQIQFARQLIDRGDEITPLPTNGPSSTQLESLYQAWPLTDDFRSHKSSKTQPIFFTSPFLLLYQCPKYEFGSIPGEPHLIELRKGADINRRAAGAYRPPMRQKENKQFSPKLNAICLFSYPPVFMLFAQQVCRDVVIKLT